MKIHREGFRIITVTALFWGVVALLAVVFLSGWAMWSVVGLAVVGTLFIVRFFREPKRSLLQDDRAVYAPADGTIVIIQEAEVAEYLGERRMQVSIFMSIWNVHINWFPVGGTVAYFKHHPGKYFIASLPKASELNEHTTVVVDTGREKILFRQIAGFVARRIVPYAKAGEQFGQNTQCGFIKFGSRVDLFLPLDAEILVKNGQKVTGTQTVIARL
ncbi:MAG: phosphatidylserine decarboxylase family protein [Rikenellaceae bacterium]|jgi:phosphatidylserine decarboxylase|nr:phosphatidylserine decarboxylase family protein [Rikenellaceae bacterium]